jgi:acetyltransferase-like isoleucine patch superfamily enzyme
MLKDLMRPFYSRICLAWFRFGQVGRDVYVNHTVRVENARHIVLGDDVRIHRGSILEASGKSRSLIVGDGCRVERYVTMQVRMGHIKIGRNVYVATYAILRGDGGLEIGDHVLISPQVVIMAGNHVFQNPYLPIREQGETHKGIRIEDDVWIGCGAKILDGVTLGRGSVVGAGAVVTKNIPPFSLAVGVPARVIARRGEPRTRSPSDMFMNRQDANTV